MIPKSRNQRISELVNYIQNYEMYQELFKEIDMDIRKTIEREKRKKLKIGYPKP